MQQAKVIGTTRATVKHRSLTGWKLLIVQPLMADNQTPDGDPIIVADSLGARQQDNVMISSDGAAVKDLIGNEQTPMRYMVLGIVD